LSFYRENIDYNKKVKEVFEKNKAIKALPYPANNNDHINNIYKIYAPYIKQSPVKYNKYTIEKKSPNANYLKNIEKYYDYYNIYKPKKNMEDNSKINVVPKRKLSPIRKTGVGVN
jgi:hypothetical protein